MTTRLSADSPPIDCGMLPLLGAAIEGAHFEETTRHTHTLVFEQTESRPISLFLSVFFASFLSRWTPPSFLSLFSRVMKFPYSLGRFFCTFISTVNHLLFSLLFSPSLGPDQTILETHHSEKDFSIGELQGSFLRLSLPLLKEVCKSVPRARGVIMISVTPFPLSILPPVSPQCLPFFVAPSAFPESGDGAPCGGIHGLRTSKSFLHGSRHGILFFNRFPEGIMLSSWSLKPTVVPSPFVLLAVGFLIWKL